jgi:hypothetical protein
LKLRFKLFKFLQSYLRSPAGGGAGLSGAQCGALRLRNQAAEVAVIRRAVYGSPKKITRC